MELQNLSTIFQGKLLRIPDYQRGYAWQQNQLSDFWEDVNNLHDEQKHYTGLLSLKKLNNVANAAAEDRWMFQKNYESFYVVDGQQRLTTFIILLNEILNIIRNSPENAGKTDDKIVIGVEKASEIVEKYIYQVKPDEIIKTYIFNYEKDNPSSEYLRHKIFGEENSGQLSETYYTKNLKSVKDFFTRNLSGIVEKDGITGIVSLYKKLTQCMVFNVYQIEEDYDVFVAFETMNNRGRALTNLELLKNRLIYITTQYPPEKLGDDAKVVLRKEINDGWSEVYNQIGRNAHTLLSDDEYLRAHWISYYPYTRSASDAYKNFLLKKFSIKNILEKRAYVKAEDENVMPSDDFDVDDEPDQEPPQDDAPTETFLEPSEIKDYVQSLKNLSKYWYATFFPTESDFLAEEEKLWIGRLNRIKINYFRPLAMVAISKQNINSEERVLLFKAIERFIFIVFRLGTINASYKSSEFYRDAEKLNNGLISIAEITNSLEALSKENMDLAVSAFIKKTEKRFEDGSGYYGWNSIKYFLYEYEHGLFEKNEIKKIDWNLFSKSEKDKVSIEHIYPQTPDCDYWKNAFTGYSEKERQNFSGAIGNLLPLAQSINSSLQNYSFPTKKSGVTEDGHAVRRGYANGSHSEIEVSKYQDWTPKEICERSRKLIEFMNARWRIELSDEQVEKLIYVRV